MSNIVIETLESLKDYVPKMIDANNKLVQLFREENTLKTFELFPPFIEGLDWIFQAVVLINSQEPFFTFDMVSLNDFFNEINEGINQSDFVVIADILEYELSPLLELILTSVKG